MQIGLSDFNAVIFDMDGVLIDSEPLWKIAMEEVFQSNGSKLSKTDFQKTTGLRIDEAVLYWHEKEGWLKPAREVEAEIVLKMKSLLHEHGKLLSGVGEILSYLSKRDIKIGLATSSYEILMETVLDGLGIRSFFHCAHSAENEPFGKPHPAVFLTAAQKLGSEPGRCLVIEDSLNGIIAAKAARMKVVCIPEKTHQHEPRLSLADFQFDNMLKMLEALI